MSDSCCTWTGFYVEFADKLLAFKNDRQTLIEKLRSVYGAIGMKLPKLDSDGVPGDIDPFTVFGLFNKGITEAKRKKIVAGLASEFGVAAPLPDDFAGAPVLSNFNATFYAFSDDAHRDEGDIDRLWNIFAAALAYADASDAASKAEFSSAYNAVLHQFGISWNITMGLHWVRPYSFVNLDSRNRWYLGLPENMPAEISAEVDSLKAVPETEEYLGLSDRILAAMQSGGYEYKTFPELSMYAWKVSEEVNQQNEEREKEKEKATQAASLGDAGIETVRYWLYAPGEGAHMWDEFYERGVMGLGWSELGDLAGYTTKEDMRQRLLEVCGDETSQKNSAHAVWQFAHDIKPGDVVFAKRGRTEILGRGIVTGEYEYDEAGGQYPHLRTVAWSKKGSWRNDEQFAMKTLTDVTDYPEFVAKIEGYFEDGEEQAIDVEGPTAKYPEYSKEQFLEEVYIDESVYDTLVGVLHSKKNIILQGAPGVGKTFVAKRLAYSMMGVKDASRVMMVQFHQSYSYEDFIEGYRPSADGFELVKGAFYTFCKRAAEDEDNDYFFIIDEINRGNLSKIFGELFMLIENDKRGSKNKLQLLYSRELFYVPSNVYLVGMMNTADRSLAMLDYALRRRFAFFDLKPGFVSEGFREYRSGLASPKLDALVQAVERLNETIAADESLGEGFQIGHSYFCRMEPGDATDAKLASIVDYELVPMLREYWFDEPVKVREWSDRLREALR